jgi:metallophosphoesterase (TIGR00282 family)
VTVRLLFVGDVVGRPGREVLARGLPRLRARHRPDLVVVNGENAAGGIGLTPATAKEIRKAGADVLTGGNHSWDKREIVPYLADHPEVLRPANFPEGTPGSGVHVLEAVPGVPVAVLNLQGRVFLDAIDDPFRCADVHLATLSARGTRLVVVDFHAEATSEKIAMGRHLDGRVAAVLGTHTPVPTADETILPGGTAYITDVGMTGPYDSVIGVRTEQALERFRTQRPVRYSVADGDPRIAAVLVDADPETGRATAIERIAWTPGEEDASL